MEPQEGVQGAQGCSTAQMEKKKSLSKSNLVASTNSQILAPVGCWQAPQLAGYFHYLLKRTVGSNVLLPEVLFSR